MSEKNMRYCLLLDFYGDVLPESQRTMMDLYYNEDFSLTEIADEVGITRQGVRDSVRRAEETLASLEDSLGMLARFETLRRQRTEILSALDQLAKLCQNENDTDKAKAYASALESVRTQLTQLEI
ncbi:MAG: sigma factor-like helix-turn-helix DNA-binding protein [Eubacteriales bacterium]